MADEVQKVILIPRFTTLLGNDSFSTAPIQVRSFGSAVVSFWRGQVSNGSGSTDVYGRFEQSPDLENWFLSGTEVTLLADQENTQSYDLTMDWVRLVIRLVDGGAQPAVTCWAVGNFVRRRA